MTKFLIIRHGQSRANLECRFAGHLNTPLSELGLRQAECSADYIASHYTVDTILASDLDRAFQTAQALADRIHLPVQKAPEFREIFAGEWEGMSFEELNARGGEAWNIWRNNVGCSVCPGGESVAHLQERILAAFRSAAEKYDGQTVAVATHATPIRVLECHCAGLPLTQLKDIPWVPNASVTTVLCENGILTMECVGYAEHLAEMQTNLPANV